MSPIPLGWAFLPVAFLLGALHALEPGHGKSLTSAYLVAGRHTWRDAAVLGLATTVSHTAVVVVLALGGLWLGSRLPASSVERGVGVLGALALVAVGGFVAARAVRDLRHGHSHGHGHPHGHGHDHGPGAARGDAGGSLWALAALGLGNGVIPCPGALAALLVALSLGRPALGLTTVLVYSLGLAAALAAIGILVIEAGRRARAWLPSDRALLWLPLASGCLVLGTGVWLLVR